MKKPAKKAAACEASTPLCSGELMATYGVNGSEKEKQLFRICGACAVYIRRGGSRLLTVR